MRAGLDTCGASGTSLYQRSQTGRFRSGQTGQTVNLLALRLRWFESSPAHFRSSATIQNKIKSDDRSKNLTLALRGRSSALIPKTTATCVLLSEGDGRGEAGGF